MWKDFLSLVRQVLTLSKDMEQTRSDIRDLQTKVEKIMLSLQRVSDEIVITREREQAARENLALQLENKYLEKEQAKLRESAKALPPIKRGRKGTKKGSKR